MVQIRNSISCLKEADTYSLILFSLFKLRDIPEYSSLSELAYVLDKDNLLKLCEYFGGLTIKIPTIDELESIVYSLILYQLVDIDKMDFDTALKTIGHKYSDLRKVKADYRKIQDVLKKYSFGGH